jgi:hypothetical protein
VASSGNVTDEVIMEYIRAQEDIEPGDGGENFHAYLRTYRLQPIVVQFRFMQVQGIRTALAKVLANGAALAHVAVAKMAWCR